jgi:hypothetical protein
MHKLLSYFILSPKDVGMERYTLNEIADSMKPSNARQSQGLNQFAKFMESLYNSERSEKSTSNNNAKDVAPQSSHL